MGTTFLMAFALMLVLEGVLPFVAPTLWRETFARITPQVARIDAHLLNRKGVTRLCYCGSVLHTRPATPGATREPLQIGAEIYGAAGVDADLEVQKLLCDALKLARLSDLRLDIGHVAVFRSIAQAAKLGAELEGQLL